MNDKFQNLSIEKILSTNELSFSDLEDDLVNKFNVSKEQLHNLLLESENIDEFLDKLSRSAQEISVSIDQ